MSEGAAILLDPFAETVFGEFAIQSGMFGGTAPIANKRVRREMLQSWRQIEGDLRLSPFVERYETLLADLWRLGSLKDDWDGHGAETPSHSSMRHADSALRRSLALLLLPNSIVASAEGGVALCWDRNQNHGYIEFNNDETAVAAYYDENGAPYIDEIAISDTAAIDKSLAQIATFVQRQ